jgi:WD40 repeat protein
MQVWRMIIGAPEEWKWERTLMTADGGSVVCMVGLGPGRVATGSADKAVRVWNVAIGMVERTLRVGRMVGRVVAMAVDWPRLVAASSNGMVLVWSLETGQCERAVQAFPDQGDGEAGDSEGEEPQRMGKVQCLAVQGSKVVAGTDRGEMLVWHARTLEVVGVLELPGWPVVRSLVEDRGLMLGCVGSDLVEWGGRDLSVGGDLREPND